MPKMDGIEAAKIIRELGYTQPIVALTANAIAGQAAIFMENGFDDFISKPIDIRQLNMALNRLIRDKYPSEVVEAARKQKETMHTTSEPQSPPGQQIAEFFVRDAKKAIKELETVFLNKCRRDDDISTFVIYSHAMKSALANIGEIALSAEAAKLETSGREKNKEQILSDLPPFMEKLRAVIEKLEPAGDTAIDPDNAGDNQLLKENLLAVKEACASLNKRAAKTALAEIKQKTWPRAINEQINTISAHLLHSEFEEAAKVIDACVEKI